MVERELLEKLKLGDASAYNYLFTEYYNWLCNYILQLCNDRRLSEDIVQEVMISFWEKRKRVMITSSLKNYLFRSCHNQFLQYVRKEKVKYDFLDQIRWDALAEVHIEVELQEEGKYNKLYQLINQLPPRCKEVFLKNKFEKQKYKDIAVDLGISIKTVENQMSKALHFLRENATSLFL